MPPGRNDWVVGNIRASRDRGFDTLNFSCSVDLRDGDVRSVDLNPPLVAASRARSHCELRA